MPGRRAPCAIGFAILAMGCQSLLGLEHIHASPDAAAGSDALASAPPPCAATTFIDDFSGSAACAPGATVWPPGAQVSQNHDSVSILPPIVPGGAAGCITNQMFEGGAGGVEVQLLGVIDGTDTYAGLQLAGPDVALGSIDGMLTFSDLSMKKPYGAIPYDAQRMAWLRIRPDGPSGALIGEYHDGTSWHIVGTSPVQNAPGTITLVASLDTNTAYDGATVFAQLRVCN